MKFLLHIFIILLLIALAVAVVAGDFIVRSTFYALTGMVRS